VRRSVATWVFLFGWTASSASAGGETLVVGRALVLKDTRDALRIAFVATDRAIVAPTPGSSDDPRFTGAVLTVRATTGPTTEDTVVALPAEGWTIAPGSGASYRFTDPEPPADGRPPRTALVKNGLLKVKVHATDGALDWSRGTEVAVRLDSGACAWCASFERRSTRSGTDVFRARRQRDRPGACLEVCGCGDGRCQGDEDATSCPDDCRVRRTVMFPFAVADCGLFDFFRASGSCADLPYLFLQPRDLSCAYGTGAAMIARLPAECCAGGICGGGQAEELAIGDSLDLYNGQLNSVLHLLEDCVEDQGIDEFVVPLVPCPAAGSISCGAESVPILGFATARATRVVDLGREKRFDLEFLCTPDGPCGLGVCPSDCASCAADCGGCAPACPD
jgi:hypothetical protein